MPIPFVNFLHQPYENPAFKELGNIMQTYRQGQQAGLNAQQGQQELQMQRELGPFKGLTGPAAEALSVELAKRRFGEDSPEYKMARDRYELNNRNLESTIASRDIYAETLPKRIASPVVKHALEQQELNEGNIPGTDININPESAKILSNQLNLLNIKNISDPKTRERVLYARNMDKTLERIDPEILVQYSGPYGAIKKKVDQGKSLSGLEQDQYQKYTNALADAKVLAKQTRQFLGDSITPEVNEQLQSLINPESWSKSPAVALSNFYEIKSLLENETETLVDALRTPEIYTPKEDLFSEQLKKTQPGNKKGSESYSDEEILRMMRGE